MAYKINSTPNAPHSITCIFHAELLFVEYLYETLETVASVKRLAIIYTSPIDVPTGICNLLGYAMCDEAGANLP